MKGIGKEIQIDINKAMSICVRNGVKVYPVPSGKLFKVEVYKEDDVTKIYDKAVSSKEVASAVRKTYIAYAKAILKEQLNAE